MPFRKIINFLGKYLTLMSCIAFAPFDAKAADYYFRPTNVAMIDSWTNELSFTISNPGKVPVVLKLKAHPVGAQKAQFRHLPDVLGISANTLVLKPGERREINLDYRPQSAVQQFSSYEVTVEQLPILYVLPGSTQKSGLMNVTRYTAEIEIRERGPRQLQYAFGQLGKKKIEVKTALLASTQIRP